MDAIIVTGQYGVGKTTTINKLLPDVLAHYGNVGVFVAESSNIAPDTARFAANPAAVTGVSFASVCCPTLADMEQALATALYQQHHRLLLIEPPGNMDPRYAIDAALGRGLDLRHVVLLASQRHHQSDRLMPTFKAALQVANMITITRRSDESSLDDLVYELSSIAHRGATILSNRPLDFSDICSLRDWRTALGYTPMSDDVQRTHSDHYKRTMRVIDPTIPEDELVKLLQSLASSGTIARAKGNVPRYQLQFDIKGTDLDITRTERGGKHETMGYLAVFSLGELPVDLINRFTVPPTYIPKQLEDTHSPEERQLIFARLFEDSKGSIPVSINGKVPISFDPVDAAYKVASEIYAIDKDDNPLRMILVPRIRTRLKALTALEASTQPDKNYVGMMVSGYLLQKLASDQGRDFPKLVDQHQLVEIKSKAVSAFFGYATTLDPDQTRHVPTYGQREAPYLLQMAQRARLFAEIRSIVPASANMARVHTQLGLEEIARGWGALARG